MYSVFPEEMMNKDYAPIGVIGLGNMGCAVAHVFASAGHSVTGWEYRGEVVEEINSRRRNSVYLPGVALDERLRATGEVTRVLRNAELLFVALPAAYIRPVLGPHTADSPPEQVVINLSKGIEPNTLRTATDVLRELFCGHEVTVMSGPSIADEFARGVPCKVLVSGGSDDAREKVRVVTQTSAFRVQISDDAAGVEWGGILKNIYAIGLGLISGSGIRSVNFRAAFLTSALDEMSELIRLLGGRKETVYSVAGLGDLIATALSAQSHHRTFGELLARGRSQSEIKEKMQGLPEGCRVLAPVCALARDRGQVLPIATGIHAVIDGAASPKEFIDSLFRPDR
ncbi:MAG: NAD(P)H-dependent glycerol-3-phosphate dehydrogenase [Candidatus Omnitrophica bacterium]|nr:NAD(P)H-dependent glycerol-3-phosphate dehydrogenase [Candidatus Omnitrophota bacterium]